MGMSGTDPLAASPFTGPQAEARASTARRLVPDYGTSTSLNRLAELAANLLGAPAAQISLLSDVQYVAGGYGLADGAVGAESPLEQSLCMVTGGSELTRSSAAASLTLSGARPATVTVHRDCSNGDSAPTAPSASP